MKKVFAVLIAMAVFLPILNVSNLAYAKEKGSIIPFSPGQNVKVSIPADVGKGVIKFQRGKKTGAIRVKLNGIPKAVNGKSCLTCMDRVELKSNVRVWTSFFHSSKVEKSTPGTRYEITEVNGETELPLNKKAKEFIVAGPSGAVLKKVGSGFTLLSGEAWLERK
jgi:hypothetical protein